MRVTHFFIFNNEVVVKKSGIVLLTVLKTINPFHYGFVGQIYIKNGIQTNQKITNLNTTGSRWFQIYKLVTQLTANTQRRTIIVSDGFFCWGKLT